MRSARQTFGGSQSRCARGWSASHLAMIPWNREPPTICEISSALICSKPLVSTLVEPKEALDTDTASPDETEEPLPRDSNNEIDRAPSSVAMPPLAEAERSAVQERVDQLLRAAESLQEQ